MVEINLMFDIRKLLMKMGSVPGTSVRIKQPDMTFGSRRFYLTIF
jgi:hypothetical protein